MAFAAYPPHDLAAQDGRIEGTVTVGEAAVEDADVVIPGLGRRVRADGAGRFAFDDVPPGSYVVEAQSVRWGRGIAAVQLTEGETVQLSIAVEAIFHLDEVIVSAGAGGLRVSDGYQSASVVTSRDLLASGEASLGETLSRVPGLSSTYFGPGASRPVIRGIGGDRVRVLEAGVGVGDASSTSPDHAVGVEPRSADRVEVIRGPATLLYGSSAVGGIVNVIDRKIARERPTQPLSGHVEGLGGSVADERTGSASVTLTRGPLVLSGSGLVRDASDYAIPGFAEVDPDPGEESGTLENSALESRQAGGGFTLVGDRGYLGLSVSAQRTEYGVPGAHEDAGGSPPMDEEPVTIDLDQNRFDMEASLRPGAAGFRNLKARFGLADYRHVELEGGAVGTRVLSDSWEGRLEAEHSLGTRTQGALGVQVASRDFESVGAEAFVPPNETRSAAVFVYEEVAATEGLRFQGGFRYERRTADAPTTAVKRTDDALSASLGLNTGLADALTVSASVSRSIKLPNAEELFSNGPHAATRAFEIGDPDLGRETALGVDLTVHAHGSRVRGSASVYTTGFSDYIHEAATGAQQAGLDEFAFVQADARFTGFEVETEIDLFTGNPAATLPHVSLVLMGDFVQAKLTETDEFLPRIPAMRVGAGLNYRRGPIVIRATARRTGRQGNLGAFETPTPGFTMVDASWSYRIFSGRFFHDITLVATNLTNTEARLHTSFLKDVAPLPGREIRLAYRLNF